MSPVVAAEAFTTLNLMAGTAKNLQQSALTPDDDKVWQRDFKLLCDELAKLADPELGSDLRSEVNFYNAANQVAKGYFNEKPFGGMKSNTGQYGFRLAGAQDLKTTAAGTTPALYSWLQTVAIASGRTLKTGAIGYSSSNVYVCSTANKQAVLAFHRLISYKPSPRIIAVEFNINGVGYAPYVVEPYSKIGKNDKLFKIIPMPGRIILHPGGYFFANLYFDMETGATLPSATPGNVDIELGVFGLVFAEYDYLAATNII